MNHLEEEAGGWCDFKSGVTSHVKQNWAGL